MDKTFGIKFLKRNDSGQYHPAIILYGRMSESTVRHIESLGYKVERCYNKSGLICSLKISWGEESLCKPKEEKPEFADDEIGAIAQEYGYILKHLRDCTIGEIVKICDNPDLNCDECGYGDLAGICDLHKLTEADLETIVRVNVPKINKEKTDE